MGDREGSAVKTAPCSGSAYGIHDGTGRSDGRCTWCLRKVYPAGRRPPPTPGVVTELTAAYRYHFDPDWGSHDDDI